MKIEPEVIEDAWKELRKNHFFKTVIEITIITMLTFAWAILVVWIATTDKLYW